jgi:hypothetical protein
MILPLAGPGPRSSLATTDHDGLKAVNEARQS